MLSHLPLFNVDKINKIHESSQKSSFLDCAIYPYVETVNGSFSVGFPIHLTGFQQKNSVLRANNRQRSHQSGVDFDVSNVPLSRRWIVGVSCWSVVEPGVKSQKNIIIGYESWSLETFLLQKIAGLSPLLKTASLLCSSLCWNTSWPVQVGTYIINAWVIHRWKSKEAYCWSRNTTPGVNIWTSHCADLTVWSSSALLDIFHGKELEAFRHTQTLSLSIHQGKIQPMSYLGRLGYVKQIDSWLFRKGHGNWGTIAWIRLLKWSHHVLSNTVAV